MADDRMVLEALHRQLHHHVSLEVTLRAAMMARHAGHRATWLLGKFTCPCGCSGDRDDYDDLVTQCR